jgi:flagellar biosynthesis/type III secretory pathway protein FliH
MTLREFLLPHHGGAPTIEETREASYEAGYKDGHGEGYKDARFDDDD